ncbi:basic amino acid/polyamine antiporter [Bacillus thuringiensis]|uniref:basic amino acid/polyamine antiporter n=1 Tax=Bacillus thuringiensis TaxID=1428 RepID=UPI000BF928B7|nr:basic amino acid/polyamine antiporter [Bacillus thuringiensis]PEY70199.1 arginine-ornithine antiporter [Bacillus thuringiensis]
MTDGVVQIEKKLGFFPLIALVVGTMVGGGVFSLPHDLAVGANSGAIIIGWCITAMGMIPLALVYQTLARQKPELEGGIYSYARAGFGEYIGFNSAWGYWLAGILGNVATIMLLFSTLGYFFPIFKGGNNVASIVGASLLLWTLHFLILFGIREASIMNVIATIGKLVPIVLFIIVMVTAFRWDTFTHDFWGEGTFSLSAILGQVKNTMLVTLWVFIGVEGAVVLSGRAKNSRDVGKATVMGLILVMSIYILISVLSMGAMTRSELSVLETPSMGHVLEHVVGPWGAVAINIGLVASLVGTLIGWFLLVSEISHVAGKDGVFPKVFTKTNKKQTPHMALWISNGVAQIIFIIVLFSESTYQIMYFIASTSILLPYLLSALFQFKLVITNELKDAKLKNGALALIASIYSVWLLYAAGLKNLLLVSIVYGIGIIVYTFARKEQGNRCFAGAEKYVMWAIIIAAITSLYMLLTGNIKM